MVSQSHTRHNHLQIVRAMPPGIQVVTSNQTAVLLKKLKSFFYYVVWIDLDLIQYLCATCTYAIGKKQIKWIGAQVENAVINNRE